jgi:RNA polymerase-binding transcription factor DksA
VTTSTASPSSNVGAEGQLTDDQRQVLRDWLTDQLTIQRERVQQATIDFEALADSDSAVDRELGREELDAALEAVVELQDALQRLEAGRYGVCVDCGKAIPFERMEAIPEADRCIGCAAAW